MKGDNAHMGLENKEILVRFDEWIDKLQSEFSDWTVLVEGKKDVTSLSNLGIDVHIVHLNKGLPILELVDRIWKANGRFEGMKKPDGILILTDWDRTGGRLARNISEKCRSLGIPFDLTMRRDIARFSGKWVQDVESLDTFYSKLKDEGDHPLT